MSPAHLRAIRVLCCSFLLASGCAAHDSAARAQQSKALARLEQQAAKLEAASPEELAAALQCPARPEGSPPVRKFGPGMTIPSCRPDGRYNVNAPSWLQGRELVITKCTILAEGRLCDCRTLSRLPEDAKARLAAWLAVQRCRPVTFQGQPLDVEYVFNIRPGR